MLSHHNQARLFRPAAAPAPYTAIDLATPEGWGAFELTLTLATKQMALEQRPYMERLLQQDTHSEPKTHRTTKLLQQSID